MAEPRAEPEVLKQGGSATVARRLAPTAAVLIAVLGIVLGGYAVAALLIEPAGPPVSVGGIARVQPLSGWEFAGRYAVAGMPAARITRGNGNLDVLATAARVPDELARRYVDRVLKPSAPRLEISEELERVQFGGQEAGARFAYVGVFDRGGAPIEGQVTVLVSSTGWGVIFDAWAPEGLLQYVRADVETMQARAELA
jgi:hypothetical protein